MARRCTTETCCLTLPLQLEKWQEDRLAKRFEIAGQIYNALARAELKKLHRLEQTPEYREIQRELRETLQVNGRESKEYKAAGKRRRELLEAAGLTEYDFKTDMKAYYKHFRENIGANVAVHGIASQVWAAFDQKLYKSGRRIHLKRPGEIQSLQGYSNAQKSGGKEIRFCGTHIEWKELRLPLKLDPENAYEAEMLSRWVKYVRILRTPGKHRDHWYAQLVLKGRPAVKRDAETGAPRHPVGHGPVGIDIGPQTIAYAAQGEASLQELADRVENIEKEKRRLQRRMDRSKRAMNPGNYAPDGTIRRGVRLSRNKSGRYRALQRELAYLQHRQAVIRKEQHVALANHLLSLGDCFYVEDMAWPSLTHRAKETVISPRTGKYQRKKRFGKSVANKAPAMLLRILQQKCDSLGLPGVVKVSTSVRASQYNHLTDTYQKKPLSQRWNEMPDGRRIQRDLYSAFLLQHMTPRLDGFDPDGLRRDYEQFTALHEKAIQQLRLAPRTLASMGLRRACS